jgi:hypothetical protein
MLCLRSWQRSGIIELDQASFTDMLVDEVDEVNDSNLVRHDDELL